MRSIGLIALLCVPLPVVTGCPSEPDSDTDAGTTTSADSDSPASAESDSTTSADSDSTTSADSDSTTSADSDSTTGSGNAIPGCECIPDDVNEGSPNAPSSLTCGEELCPTVAGSCSGSCSEDPFVLEDPAALECTLIALRDRTPGRVRWSWSEYGGQYDEAGYVLVNEDGTAVRRDWGWNDLEYVASDARLGELLPPEHFDGCLAEADDLARLHCVRGPLTATQETCDEGWTYSKF